MNHLFHARSHASVSLPILTFLIAGAACAHSTFQSAVMLDFVGTQMRVELQLPLERMNAVYGKPLDLHTLPSEQSSLATYILGKFHARTNAGLSLVGSLSAPLELASIDGAPYLLAHLAFTSPPASATRVIELEDDVILDHLPAQVALVSIRSDWNTSIFANDPQLAGVLRSRAPSLTIDRSGGSWLRGFNSVFHLGIRHIAEGADHLLFLLALLLPAPLYAAHRRWAGPASLRISILRIVKVVSAFTVGHSITLALAALGVVRVPGRPIEVLIAISILISALHALRPLFPGREAFIAASFGLIHGLAFATTLGDLGLGHWDRVASIFAFNLGIECMQLVVVAATLPSLMLLSRTGAYSAVRIGFASFAGLASLGWIGQRLLDLRTPVDSIVDRLAQNAVWIACSLAAVSLVLWSLRHRNEKRLLAGTNAPAWRSAS